MAIQLPGPNYPVVDSNGKLTPVWFQFFNTIAQNLGASGSLGDIVASSLTSSGPISATTGTFSNTLQFGEYTASVFTNTGFIIINDASGTTRRLMVG